MRAFLVIILSLIATVLTGAALLLGLPVDFAELAIWITFFLPVIWTFIMLYCCWDARKWRVFAVLIFSCFISFGIIATNPPAV